MHASRRFHFRPSAAGEENNRPERPQDGAGQMKSITGKIGSGVAGLVLAASVWASGAGSANAYVIDMEGIAPPASNTTENTSRIWGDFTLQTGHGHYIDSAHISIINGALPNNGTDWLLHDNTGLMILAKTASGSFALNALDATFRIVSSNGTTANHNILVTGSIFGGGLVTTTLTIDDNPSFQTFTFDSSWSNLAAVSFQNVQGAMAYDNIVVDAVVESVPEPGAIAILGLGLLGLAGLRRRG